MLRRKRSSMLSDLKVSSLTCKCVFDRPEHYTKEGPHGIKYTNKPSSKSR